VTPYFIGGDYSYPGQSVCKFFNTDRLHQCINEPCNNPIFPDSQQESGPAFGIAIYNPNSSGSSTTTSTTANAVPLTTHNAASLTTSKVAPLTTGVQSVTSGSSGSHPLSTGAKVVSLTTSHLSQNSPSSAGNCAGLTDVSSSTASVTSVDVWSNSFRMVIQLNVQEPVLSSWMIEVIWPSNAINTQIQSTYNGGIVACQGSSPVSHAMIKPIASWADNLTQGSTLNVELVATNTNMNSEFIMSNTVLRVYKP
jgi:hypothetical protein